MSSLSGPDVCMPYIRLFCLTEAKSGIFDEKSGTRPEKAGRMLTLTEKPLLVASYKIAYRIAKEKKLHSIAETLITGAVVKWLERPLRSR